MKRKFWKYTPKVRQMEFGLHFIQHHLAERALEDGETLEFWYNAGSLRPGISMPEVIAEMTKLGGRLLKHQILSRHSNEDWVMAWDNAGAEIEYFAKNRGITVSVRSLDLQLAMAIKTYFDGVITRTATKGRVFVVISGRNGPQLQEMGVAGEEFTPSNYHPEVVTQYKHVIDDLNKADPCGRIILLDGPPGTGKTHMVRAVLNEVPKATFVLVPSNFIASLGSPDFLAVLMREQKKDAPLILILEDADEALVNRKEGNTSAISSLLNFSDGIFGTLLDMRLICTTNVQIDNLDPAVMRDGRLCSRIEIGELDRDMANAVYERLTGKKGELKDKFYKLGTVYKIAKGNGTIIERKKQPKKQLGFAMKPEPKHETPELDAIRDLVEKLENGEIGLQPISQETLDRLDENISIVEEVIAFREGQRTPAEEHGLEPGDTGTTDEGDMFRVDEKGQFHLIDTDSDEKGTPITEVVNGELREIGYLGHDGSIVINGEEVCPPDSEDDDDLIDEDPDEDAQLLPDFIQESDDGHDDLEDEEATPRDDGAGDFED